VLHQILRLSEEDILWPKDKFYRLAFLEFIFIVDLERDIPGLEFSVTYGPVKKVRRSQESRYMLGARLAVNLEGRSGLFDPAGVQHRNAVPQLASS
jgi:hypothetical protein